MRKIILCFVCFATFVCRPSPSINEPGRQELQKKDFSYQYEYPYQKDKAPEHKKLLQQYLGGLKNASGDFDLRDQHFLIGEQFLYLGDLANAKKHFLSSYSYNPNHDHSTRIAMYMYLIESEAGDMQKAKDYYEESLAQGFAYDVIFEAPKSGLFPRTCKTEFFKQVYKTMLAAASR